MIDGREVPFRASAAVPRLYRALFRRDIFKDIVMLDRAAKNTPPGELPLDNLEMFENIAYVMAKHADPTIPDTPDEWLEDFHTFSIYEVLPEITRLWSDNMATDVTAKKNIAQLSGR